jgi:hypothetical protein
MVSYSKSLYLVIVVAGFELPASAVTPIYRCTQNGQTVLTDKPCEGNITAPTSETSGAPPSGTVGNQVLTAPSVVGDWRGQTQYQGSENGQHMEDSHTVVPLVLTFTADGKVSGASPKNGCTLLGLWSPGVTPRLFPLDITLKGCRFAGFNRRYSGNLIATFPENLAQFSLQAYTVPIPGQPIRRYDVGATLRR